MQDLRILPKLKDSLSYLFVEHAVIEQKDAAIEYINAEGRVMVPVSQLCLLILGPGTSITHAAIKTLAENGCTVLWTGEDCVRFYAHGGGETRKGYHLIHQAKMVTDPDLHMQVVLRMYKYRFKQTLDPNLTLPQIRGMEGVRVRNAYSKASRAFNVKWDGRIYDRQNWLSSDPINRALSAANSLLNGLCHSAIVSGGYSPGLGFVHSGKQLSFVYDIADLYKVEYTIPLAFSTVGTAIANVEKRVREACREKFREDKLLDRILVDVDQLLDVPHHFEGEFSADTDMAIPEPLWDETEEI